MDDAQMKEMVRARYGSIAAADASCCAPAASLCCGPEAAPDDKARRMGYSEAELASVPDGANLGLGCVNPQAIAALRPGEVVIDLGSGAGFDCFLAARQVGDTHVIGVDMTHEMLKKARDNAANIGANNVEFRLGELEHLPVADNTADVILSNCVINLVTISPLPDMSGQENHGASTGQACEPTGAEAHRPGGELRRAAELIERDAEQQCAEKAGAKADTGVEPDGCSQITRRGNGEHTRREIGKVALHDEAGNDGKC